MSQKGWVCLWKKSNRPLEGFFETKLNAVGNAIFNDIDEDVTYKEMTYTEYQKLWEQPSIACIKGELK